MVKQLGFVFDIDLCIGCKTCEVACRNENQTAGTVRWRKVTRQVDGSFLSLSCNHCSSPECFRVCPENAFTKRMDGIVEIHAERCSGCGLCMEACPYQAPQFDPITHKVTKCQMCNDRIDQGLQAACVEACPTEALTVKDLNTFCHVNAMGTTLGFPDTRLTNPSIVFLPEKERKRYFQMR